MVTTMRRILTLCLASKRRCRCFVFVANVGQDLCNDTNFVQIYGLLTQHNVDWGEPLFVNMFVCVFVLARCVCACVQE